MKGDFGDGIFVRRSSNPSGHVQLKPQADMPRGIAAQSGRSTRQEKDKLDWLLVLRHFIIRTSLTGAQGVNASRLHYFMSVLAPNTSHKA